MTARTFKSQPLLRLVSPPMSPSTTRLVLAPIRFRLASRVSLSRFGAAAAAAAEGPTRTMDTKVRAAAAVVTLARSSMSRRADFFVCCWSCRVSRCRRRQWDRRWHDIVWCNYLATEGVMASSGNSALLVASQMVVLGLVAISISTAVTVRGHCLPHQTDRRRWLWRWYGIWCPVWCPIRWSKS